MLHKLGSLAYQTKDGIGQFLICLLEVHFLKRPFFALGIMPYICFIVVQLMGIAIPYLQKLQSDGEKVERLIRLPLVDTNYVSSRSNLSIIYIELYQYNAFLLGLIHLNFIFFSDYLLSYYSICHVVREKNN
jgi:preprotein translocase subunit SecY